MKNVNTLPLADPTINEPCKVDFPHGADILEHIFLENQIRDKRLLSPESIFGWVVFGPVKEVSNSLD